MKLAANYDINKILNEFKNMDKDHIHYEFYYEIIVEHYKKWIYKIIGRQNDKSQIEEIFHEVVCHLPKFVNRWDQTKSEFSTFLVQNVRNVKQEFYVMARNVKLRDRSERYNAKKQNRPAKELILVRNSAREDNSDSLKNKKDGNFYPPVIPTIESDILVSQCREQIKDISYNDIWWMLSFEGYNIYECMKMIDYQKSETSFYRTISIADRKIKKRLAVFLDFDVHKISNKTKIKYGVKQTWNAIKNEQRRIRVEKQKVADENK
jgi:hypothetical protein